MKYSLRWKKAKMDFEEIGSEIAERKAILTEE
jgi:hypothetical protein